MITCKRSSKIQHFATNTSPKSRFASMGSDEWLGNIDNVDTVPVEQIFLFGSYANGTLHADSDLDIYVVMAQNSAKEIQDFILALVPEMF
jgi:predicted nucleotidyltransferase